MVVYDGRKEILLSPRYSPVSQGEGHYTGVPRLGYVFSCAIYSVMDLDK